MARTRDGRDPAGHDHALTATEDALAAVFREETGRLAAADLVVRAAQLRRPGPYQMRPLHDALMTAISAFGDDVDQVAKKGYLSLRRRKQFAMIQPSGAGRIDVGLILKDVPAGGRLESAAGFNALFTHRVRLAGPAGLDAELMGWLRTAYGRAG
jgi:Domain of unknown function (DUF5655)